MTTELIPLDRWPDIDGSDFEYPRLNAHHAGWLKSVCEGLGHTPLLLAFRQPSSEITGILPLALVRSLLFGRFLTSLPYLNTGGVWAENQAVARALVDHACRLADEFDARYLELRHEKRLDHEKLTAERSDKVHMRLPLPMTDEAFLKSLKSKVRSQIKKSAEHSLEVVWGGLELLDDFYCVFAVNMRDLGTPVYSKRLFQEILKAFPNSTELCVVKQRDRPIAAGLITHIDGVSEVPSASSLREFNRTNANMWMYRNLLKRAIERGSHTFDFGRSSVDSGTYKFKAQWGAIPHPASWQYYLRRGSANDMRPDAPGKKRLVELWKKLPVPVSRLIGPFIVRGIP